MSHSVTPSYCILQDFGDGAPRCPLLPLLHQEIWYQCPNPALSVSPHSPASHHQVCPGCIPRTIPCPLPVLTALQALGSYLVQAPGPVEKGPGVMRGRCGACSLGDKNC